MHYKISPISILPKTDPITTCEILVSDVDYEKEMAAGRLFFLIEIGPRSGDDEKLINLLIDDISFNYYQNEAFAYRAGGGLFRPEEILEAVLGQANAKLQKFSKESGINLSEKNLNLTVGLISGNSIHFSTSGRNRAFAISRSRENDSSAYKLHDILKHVEEDGGAETPEECVFSNIISGTLPRNGYLIFANEALSEYLSANQLIRIVTKLPPQGAALQIKNELSHINAYVSFLAIIIKSALLAEAPKPTPAIERQRSNSSIFSLNNTEKLTERFLTPSGLISLGKFSGLFGSLFQKKPRQTGPGRNKLIFVGERIVFKKTAGALTRFLAVVRAFRKNLAKSAYRLGLKLKNPKKLQYSLLKSATGLSGALKLAGRWLFGLRPTHKILLVAFFASLAVFTISISAKKNRNSGTEIAAQYQIILEQLAAKKNSIDANFIYNKNRQELKAMLDEFKMLLDSLPKTEPGYQQSYAEYLAEYEERMSKIRNVIDAEPVELAVLSQIDQQADPSWIFIDQKRIYAVDKNSGTIYEYQENGKLLTKIYPGSDKQALDAFWDGGRIIVVFKDSIASIAAAGGSADVSDSPFNNALSGSLPADIYNGRLYVLDRNANQIQRFRKAQNTYLSPENWLKGGNDLKNSLDISIDGRIYLAFSGGEVRKFLSGNKEDFTLDQIDPPLAEPIRIKASRQTDSLYILDRQNQRLAVFDKNGTFSRQFRSDLFGDLKDFAIDENNNAIYVLNGNSILKFENNKNP